MPIFLVVGLCEKKEENKMSCFSLNKHFVVVMSRTGMCCECSTNESLRTFFRNYFLKRSNLTKPFYTNMSSVRRPWVPRCTEIVMLKLFKH